MQTEPGQVLSSLKLLSQEAQVTHRQNHSLVEGVNPHVGNRMYIS